MRARVLYDHTDRERTFHGLDEDGERAYVLAVLEREHAEHAGGEHLPVELHRELARHVVAVERLERLAESDAARVQRQRRGCTAMTSIEEHARFLRIEVELDTDRADVLVGLDLHGLHL